ncbi:MAG: N-acetylmuramoyl-L-alanine amidase [Gemmatimonadetes bacterium]|nr:N-acetylmuramoyl-L-alanine amidase [Gemmatimonadota bacterium]
MSRSRRSRRARSSSSVTVMAVTGVALVVPLALLFDRGGEASPPQALELVVRYPEPGRRISPDSNVLFGSVGDPGATLEIDGVQVDVAESGGFLAWLPVPRAERDDSAYYRLVARTATDTLVVQHPIRRPRTAPPPGAPRPWVDPADVGDRIERWSGPDEPVRLEFTAEAGARLSLRIGDRAFDVPAVGPTRGELDRYRFEMPAGPLRSAACAYQTCRDHALPGSGPGRADRTTPRAARVDTLSLRIRVEKDGREWTETLRLPLAVLQRIAWPAVRLDETEDRVNGQSDVVVGRPTPFGPYRWRFPNGARLPVTARFGDRLRVRVQEGLDAWIVAEDAVWDGTANGAATTWDARVTPARPEDAPHLEDVEAVSLRVGLSRPVATRVEVTGRRSISLTLYGTYGRFDRIAHGVDTGVRSARWRQESGPAVRLDLDLAWPVWGYRASYERGDARAYEGPGEGRPLRAADDGEAILRLDIRRAPDVDASRPLAGRRIAIDPGHPGAGSTGPTGLFEGDANLAIARVLVRELASADAIPILIRENTSALGLYDRTRRARERGAELFVSIHNNALPDGIRPFERAGTTTYYYHRHAAALGEAIQRAMVERLGLRDLGLVWGDLAVAREPWMPSALAEGAFMIIPEQEAALRTAEFQAAYARGVREGIEAFLRSFAASDPRP